MLATEHWYGGTVYMTWGIPAIPNCSWWHAWGAIVSGAGWWGSLTLHSITSSTTASSKASKHSQKLTPSHNQQDQPQQDLYQAQSTLGWQQLYYSCLSPLWLTLHNQKHPTINAIHYFTKHAILIWQVILHTWKLRNQHLHPMNHLQEDSTQLQAAVYQIIHNASQDPIL